MVTLTADLSGMEAFNKFRQEFPDKLKKVIEEVANELRTRVLSETPFEEGTARKSWSELQRISNGFSFSTHIPYMHVLEYGLYPGVGKVRPGESVPRTIETGTGIYSRQAIEGWIRKYIESDEAMTKIFNLVVEQTLSKEQGFK